MGFHDLEPVNQAACADPSKSMGCGAAMRNWRAAKLGMGRACRGGAPLHKGRMKVYAMITELAGRARYVKFGMASDPHRRLMEVQCGCPLRIEKIMYVDCGADDPAIALEAALHIEHADSRCSGEWFKWGAGSKAAAEATEALVLIGQREVGDMRVIVHDVPRPKSRYAHTVGRYRNAASRSFAANSVVGNADISTVPIQVKRRRGA